MAWHIDFKRNDFFGFKGMFLYISKYFDGLYIHTGKVNILIVQMQLGIRFSVVIIVVESFSFMHQPTAA